MKYAFLFGGFTGFSLTLLVSWASGRTAEKAFVDAAIACLLSAYVFRWMWSIVISSFRQTLNERKAMHAALVAKETPVTSTSQSK
ncbi:MAG: hypothetical protein SFY80_17175 [Verrucomicrobiota bacterium]|nr:hypothetical protein [Verrucomicrobiota bacterium]